MGKIPPHTYLWKRWSAISWWEIPRIYHGLVPDTGLSLYGRCGRDHSHLRLTVWLRPGNFRVVSMGLEILPLSGGSPQADQGIRRLGSLHLLLVPNTAISWLWPTPGSGMLVDLHRFLPDPPLISRTLTTSFFIWFILVRDEPHVSWMTRPDFNTCATEHSACE